MIDGKILQHNSRISLMKILCCMLVVLGHTSQNAASFIYSFHMPFFFILSGYTLKEKHYDSVSSTVRYIKGKVIKLYIPYVIFNLLFIILNNTFIRIGFYTNKSSAIGLGFSYSSQMTVKDMVIESLKVFLFAGGTGMGGVLWFLRVLFICNFMNIIIEYFARKLITLEKNREIIRLVIYISIFILGYVCSQENIGSLLNLGASCSALLFVYVGMLLAKNALSIKRISDGKVVAAIAVVMFAVVFVLSKYETVNLGANEYQNPIVLLCSSIAGWFLLEALCTFVTNAVGNKGIWLNRVAECNIWVMAFQFLVFKLVNYFVVNANGLPRWYVAAHPVASEQYWLVYTILGYVLPVLVGIIHSKAIYHLRQKKTLK